MPLLIGTSRTLLSPFDQVPIASGPTIGSKSTGTNNLTLGGTATINAPASIVAGNLLIALLSCGGQTFTAPLGWSLYGTQAASGNSPQISVFIKIATGMEPPAYAFVPSVSADAVNGIILNVSDANTFSPINGMFSKYTSTAATTIGTAAVSIPTVLNCLPIAISAIQQLNLSTTGNPTSLTGGWTGQALTVNIDGGNPGGTGNNNGYNAMYSASGPITSSTSTAITAGWTWGGGSSNFTGTSVVLFVAP
jgi:hypothetical protein